MDWECYVPFNRAMDDGSEGIGAKRGFANQNSTIRKARGSGRDLMHPVDNIITNVTKMVNAAQRNQVMVAAVQAAANVPDTARFMEAVPTPMRQKTANLRDTKKQLIGSVLETNIDPASTEAVLGLIEGLDDILIQYTQGKPHGDVVAVLMGGQPEFYKINDPLLLKSLANMAPRQANAILDAYGRVTRFITGNITGRNVVWSLMSNAPRDLMTLFTYSKDKNPAHLFGGIASAYVNKVKGKNADPLYKEYLAMGGGKTSAYTADKNLQANVRQKLAGKSQWWNPLEWMDFISDTVESGPRYATYKVLREKKGMSPQEAFYESADVTTNFRRGGTLSRDLNKIIPFFNAGMQGVDKFTRWITAEDAKPGTRKKAAATRMSQYVLASTAMALLMHGLNSGDDEKKKEYAQLSGYTKNSYWTIPLGDGKYFTIPKPREIAVLSSFIQASLDRYANENKGAFDGFYEYATNAFLPNVASDLAQIDVFGALGNLGFFGTAFHMGANKDFMGRPIVSKSLERLEQKDQFTRRTSKAAKALGEALGESPQMIDYFFQNTLGGFWKWQAALFPVGDEYTDYTLGVKSSYVRDNLYSTDIINHLYDQRDAAEKAKNSRPDSTEAESRYKWLNNMTGFYGKYQKLSKGEPETDTNRGVRQTVLDMAAGINNYARFGDMTPEMQALDAFAETSKTTEFYPAVMSESVKDGNGMLHALTAVQYVDYQTDYLSRYWDYVPGTLADPATASVDGLNTAKDQAKMEATARILMMIGAEGKETEKVRGMVAGGIDSKTSIRFGTAIDGAYADGSLTKDEVLAILDGMDLTDPQRAYLYSTRYSGVTGNVYASVEDINAYLLTANPDSCKQSLTSTYKPLVIARYMAGDDAGVEELLMKLEALDVYDAKWKPYYTRDRVYGWIDDFLKSAQ